MIVEFGAVVLGNKVVFGTRLCLVPDIDYN
jgi:hypothetical protein